MTKQIPQCSRKNLLVVLSAVVLGTLGLIWAKAHAESSSSESHVLVSQSIPSYRQRVRFWIHGDGLRPRIAHAKPGTVLLTCENKTLLDAELIVERASLNQIVQAVGVIGVSSSVRRATQEVVLTPGDYVVYERSRPEMKATLVVSPQIF
jgi:hypothetical protein